MAEKGKKENKSEAIKVKNLNKTFKIKLKEAGLKGSVRSLFSPRYKKIEAVNNISFEVAEGDLVGFIGPNGAGKSTTLKMLSGILYPDSGSITVDGLNPQKDRKKLAYGIGTVFGQKPQLWFHLPAMDSFNLFSKIYDLDEKEYRTRLDRLIRLFEIEDIVQQPVRKLSLGQRMRCEFVLSLLHKPKILFLDEPTIGMDIIAKKTIRELIKKVNQEEKVTVILTSHDMDDIETICKRMIIINKGSIVYDGNIRDVKKRYLTKKIIRIASDEELDVKKSQGVEILKIKGFAAKISVDTKKASLKKVIDSLLRKNSINDITIEEPPIEEVIEKIYSS